MPTATEDRSLIAALSRRWYLAILLMVPLAVGGWFAGQQVGVSWRTSGSFGLVGPSVETQPEPGTGDIIQVDVNPYAGGNGYGNFAQQIGAVLDSNGVRNDFERQGFSENYEVIIDRGAGIVSFDVASDDPKVALYTAQQLMTVARTQIEERQEIAQVEEALLARFSPISEPSEAEEDQARRIQASLGLAALGVFLAMILTAVLDAILLGRRRRKETKLAAAEAADPPDESWSESSLWDEDAMVDDGFDEVSTPKLMGENGLSNLLGDEAEPTSRRS